MLVRAKEDYDRYQRPIEVRSAPERQFQDATRAYRTAQADGLDCHGGQVVPGVANGEGVVAEGGGGDFSEGAVGAASGAPTANSSRATAV